MATLKYSHPDFVENSEIKPKNARSEFRGKYLVKLKSKDSTTFSDKRCLQMAEKLNKRHFIGGKGREWASQSLKILENLMNLENAKLMCSPLDPIVHQEFYSMIETPLDLSKILLNLHSGRYENFNDFRQDIEQIFDQYKRYFSNKDIKIFNKIEKLEINIETKLEKIPKLCNRILLDNETHELSMLTNGDMLSERIQRIQEENERVLNQATIPKAVYKSKPLTQHDQIFNSQKKSNQKINYSFRIGNNKKHITIANNKITPQIVKSAISLSSPKNSSMESEFLDESSSQVDRCLEREMEKAGVQVLLNVTSIWFGACRQLPIAPIIVKENGFYMRFLIEGREDTLVDFQIPAHEIVRCCGYHGNERKHTIFIFLLPSCVSRMIESRLIGDIGGSGATSLHATLVALFMPALREDDMAKLIYLLWSMGKCSLFRSTDFYSEIDQTVALKLMSNTNPNINKKDIPAKQPQAVSILKAKKRNLSDIMSLNNKKKYIIPTIQRVDSVNVDDENDYFLKIKEEPQDEDPSDNSSPNSNETFEKCPKIEEQYSIFHCVPDGLGGYTLTKTPKDGNFEEMNGNYQSDDNMQMRETNLTTKK